MTSERWEQVKRIYDSALKREASQRAAYLDQACAHDAAVRQEVESLLDYEIQAESFIEAPALAVAAGLLASETARSPVGQRIGPYQVLSLLGAGGMGEVYLADDSRLGRKVALKLLPSRYTQEAERMRRFDREARATSALNHPNILTIHEIGQVDETHYLVTEYVDGQTLRQRMKTARLKLDEAVDVAVQIAGALAAAHEAAIVHRDIKPENIMVRHDGIVKVLDFGLAKLTEPAPSAVDSQAASLATNSTDTGVVLGTVRYMSPEQARGQKVDERSDIFSLGTVLYEMIAGRAPFEGETTNDTIAALLAKEPQTLSQSSPEVPLELERIVMKALRKDREERFQVVRDMLGELRSLKYRLDSAALEHSSPREDDADLAVESTKTAATVMASRALSTGEAPPAESTRSLVLRFTSNRRIAVIATAGLFIAAAGITYLLLFARPAGAIESIAVLPLANASNDPNVDYLSDGISEALINSLTELQQLRVVARSTAFRYRGKDADPQSVGRELKVRAVLTGIVHQSGDALDIQVDLVDAQTGAELWGKTYERKVSEVLSVKQAIAQEVTEKLRLGLSGKQQHQLTKRDTTNAEAYRFYLRGRYYWNKRTVDGLKKAIEQFQQSIDRDPNYALGYVGLADCYVILEEYSGAPASETLPKARAAADRALAIDDSLSEAHASSAYVYHSLWRWQEAEEEFKRAIKLNPNYPTAHQWFSFYLRTRRRFDEDEREIRRAQEIDPLSPIIGSNVAVADILKNDLNAAIEESNRIIELDPTFPWAYGELGFAYLKQRRDEAATQAFQTAVELSKRASVHLSDLGCCYAVTGKRDQAVAILQELKDKYARGEAVGQYLAGVYAGLGDKKEAFVWLEKDYQQHSGYLPIITWWYCFDDVRDDPKYIDLVHRMGL
jgi:serine/threonine-protein kinase